MSKRRLVICYVASHSVLNVQMALPQSGRGTKKFALRFPQLPFLRLFLPVRDPRFEMCSISGIVPQSAIPYVSKCKVCKVIQVKYEVFVMLSV